MLTKSGFETSVQYHRPRVGEHFTNAHDELTRIDAVYYETRRGIFRVSFLTQDSPTGRRGVQIERGPDGEWRQWLGPDPREAA